jgi:hypothetical protein
LDGGPGEEDEMKTKMRREEKGGRGREVYV